MKQDGFFKIASCYIRQRWKIFAAALLFSAIFLVVFYLYNLPIEAVTYAFALCLSIGLLLTALDFSGYRKKYLLLQQLQNQITITLENLPAPEGAIEELYQELITVLDDHRRRIISDADLSRTEMIDYYTLWAHQIKTPIAAMHLLLQSENSETNAALDAELFKVEQYVEMVLQYLRLEDMSSDLKLQSYSLDKIVRQAVRKYAKLFILKKISLHFSELDCTVLTDEKWLCFVIEQLLSNALKYTYQGSISIYMDPDADKTLVIEDTGIGIQPEDLPRVFEKGFTGYNGRTDKKSTGIGLYLCKQITTRLSHVLTIESEVGKGTKVRLDLSTLEMVIE